MRIAASSHGSALGAFKALPERVQPCGKSSASSDLGRESSAFTSSGKQSPPHLTVELVSQRETVRPDPFWDGPRLRPVFVAQVIGQAMPERARPLAHAAYGALEPRRARLLDRKS